MKFKPQKFLSLLTASLLAAGGLVGLAAAPANAAPTVENFTGWSYPSANFGNNSSEAAVPSDTTAGSGGALKMTKGNETWSGVTFKALTRAEFISLPSAQDTEIFTAQIYVPSGTYNVGTPRKVRLKFEDAGNGNRNVETDYTITADGWQLATWTVTNASTGSFWDGNATQHPAFAQATTYDKVSVLVDADRAVPGAIWYMDDFSYTVHPVYSTVENFTGWSYPSANFGNNSSEAAVPSDTTAGSGVALKMTKGNETWSGVTFKALTGAEFISLPSAQDTEYFGAQIYVPSGTYNVGTPRKVRLKFEDSNDGNRNVEADYVITGDGWQAATWSVTTATTGTFWDGSANQHPAFAQATTYDKVSVLVDADRAVPGAIWYMDDFSYNPHVIQSQTAHPQILATFETSDTNSYNTGAVCGVSADASSVPPVGGSSGSLKSAKVTFAGGGCEAYPLWTFMSLTTGSSLISSTHPTVSMNFFSRTGGETPVLKFETGPQQGGIERPANETVVAGWQTLTFTFSNVSDSASYRLATLFPQGTSVTTPRTTAYYFDDVAFNGASTPAITISGIPSTPIKNYDVRLISSIKNTAVDANEFTACNWLNCADNKYYFKMLAAGSTTTLTYLVTEHGTATVVPSASVKLRINTSYSGSNATWTTSNGAAGAVSTGAGPDGGSITASTNSSGLVSFDITNTNNSGEAARTLNDANPYPSGCSSPAGQTKGALQPEVMAVSGVEIGLQYVDVLWPHITSTTINPAVAAGSDGSNCPLPAGSAGPAAPVSPFDMGRYPHLRLEKSLLNNKYDASWWDGVWQFRDADTQAFLKFIPVGSTFTLTYVVTGDNGLPLVDAPVSLIVNANYSCSKTFFAYEGSLIGPDDCSGGGETELPAKKTDSTGRVSFTLTNTNTTGEAMPADLNGLPNGKELGTNIKPNLVGAKRQGIDMLFAHFVESSDANKVAGPGTVTATIGKSHSTTFTFLDAAGKALVNTDVKYYVNGFDSKIGFAATDAQGRVTIYSTNSSGQAGMQTVGVSIERTGLLPLTASATVNWEAPVLAVSAAGAKGAVVVKVDGAAGKTVKITIAGKAYTRVANSQNAEFSFPTTVGKKVVKVSVAGKTLSKSVTVSKK